MKTQRTTVIKPKARIQLQYENCPRTEDGMEIRASYKCPSCKGRGWTFGNALISLGNPDMIQKGDFSELG